MLALELFKGNAKKPVQIAADIRERVLPFIVPCGDTHSETTLRHLADPLYRSKYYVYQWSDVYARDLYQHIQSIENGWLQYRKCVLEAGGGTDPNVLLERFLGRQPSVKPFGESFVIPK